MMQTLAHPSPLMPLASWQGAPKGNTEQPGSGLTWDPIWVAPYPFHHHELGKQGMRGLFLDRRRLSSV